MSVSASTTNSAMQRALRLPEIVSLIVEAIDQDVCARHGCHINTFEDIDCSRNQFEVFQHKRRALGPIACLNHMWFALVIPRLWRHICDPCLPTLFQGIAPARRNMYAQYIELGTIMVCEDPQPSQNGSQNDAEQSKPDSRMGSADILSGIEFPRLKWLVVRDAPGRFMPRLGRNRIESIFLVPYTCSIEGIEGTSVFDVAKVLDLILVSSPHMRHQDTEKESRLGWNKVALGADYLNPKAMDTVFPHVKKLRPIALYAGDDTTYAQLERYVRIRRNRAAKPGNSVPFEVDVRGVRSVGWMKDESYCFIFTG